MQIDDHLEDERKEYEADLARYAEYYADNESEIPSVSTIPAADAIATLADQMRLLGVPEEDEDEYADAHSCGDSDCQGEHTHAYADEYYETGHVSPSTLAYNELMPYCPATPDYYVCEDYLDNV
jgi:hypothetical protein